MKKIILSFFIAAISHTAFSQIASCCSAASENFAAFAVDLGFINKHQEPLPFHYYSSDAEMITFKATDGKDAHAYMIKTEKPSNKYLLVFHEWWGLNDYIKQISVNLFTDLGDVNVIALDIYDGRIATTKEQAKEYMSKMSSERARAIIGGIKNKIGADARVATIGWCMGGAWSLQAALAFEENAKACVMYYGMPETDIEKIKTLEAPVLFIHAAQDKWINDEVVATFETNMQTANKKIRILRYDADHAFANPSNPKHNEEQARDAYANVLVFLKENF